MAVVCHFPVTVRVCGKLTDKRLALLSAELEQALLDRIGDARLELVRRGLADASITFRESLEAMFSPKPPIWQQPGLLVEPLRWPEVLGPEPTALDFAADDAIDLAVRLLINALDPLTKAPRAAKVDWTKVWPMVVQQVRSPQKAPRKGVPPELFDPSLVDALRQLSLAGGVPVDDKEVNRRQTEVLDRAYAYLLGALGMTDYEDLVDLAVRLLISALDPLTKPPRAATVRWGSVWPTVVEQVKSPRRTPRKGAPAELYEPSLVRVLELLTVSSDGIVDKEESDRRKAEVLDSVYGHLLGVLGQLEDEDVVDLAVRLLTAALAPLTMPPQSSKTNWGDVWPAIVQQVKNPRRAHRKGMPAEIYQSPLVDILELLPLDSERRLDEKEATERTSKVLELTLDNLREALGRLEGEDEVNLAVRLLEDALEPLTALADTPWSKVWPQTVRQVSEPRKDQRQGDRDELYDPPLVDALQLLSLAGKGWVDKETAGKRKAKVLRETAEFLLTATEHRRGREAVDPAKELDTIGPVAANNMFPSVKKVKLVDAYLEVRAALLVEFGALDVGVESALKRIGAFYGNKIKDVTFLGRTISVHEEMARRLQKAQDKLLGSLAAIIPTVKSIESIQIRANANNPLSLSLHSFGFAIDMNPEFNPNIPNFPVEFIEDVINQDLLLIPGQKPRKKDDVFDIGKIAEELIFGKPDAALAETARLLAASQQFQSVFSSEASLAQGVRAVAGYRNAAVPTPTGPASDTDLLTKLRNALVEGSVVPWRYQSEVHLQKRVRQGVAHDALAELFFPLSQNPLPEPFKSAEEKRATIELLIHMVKVFDLSVRKRKKSGELVRVDPGTTLPAGEAALPQIAAYGFLNLPEIVIEALRASDGGDLKWLGPSTVHDFMHFEIKHKDLPNRY